MHSPDIQTQKIKTASFDIVPISFAFICIQLHKKA